MPGSFWHFKERGAAAQAGGWSLGTVGRVGVPLESPRIAALPAPTASTQHIIGTHGASAELYAERWAASLEVTLDVPPSSGDRAARGPQAHLSALSALYPGSGKGRGVGVSQPPHRAGPPLPSSPGREPPSGQCPVGGPRLCGGA